MLTAGREVELCQRAQAGDPAAWEQLLAANQGLCHRLAGRVRRPGFDYEDALQEARLGFLEGARRFDPARGNRLSTVVVPWMLQRLRRAAADATRPIRFPAHAHEADDKLRRAEARLAAELGREPTDEELLAVTRWRPAQLAAARRLPAQPLSLDHPIDSNYKGGAESETTLGELQEDERAAADLARVTGEDATREVLGRILAELPRRLADTLQRRMGLPPYNARQSMQRIADEHGVSREAVRQWELRGLRQARLVARRLGVQADDL